MLFEETVPGTAINPAAAAKKITHKGQAHFAGTGPKGETCRTCVYWAFDTPKYKVDGTLHAQRCNKYKQLMRAAGNKIPHEAHACRHYEAAANERHRQNPER